jgi:hypothetical protein
MWSSQTDQSFPLSSVKPLSGLASYRARCAEATRAAIARSSVVRSACPADGSTLAPVGEVERLAYVRCVACGSLYLRQVAGPEDWAETVAAAARFRHGTNGLQATIVETRAAHVYGPKLEWIEDTLRLQGLARPTVLEASTTLSDFTPLIRRSRAMGDVVTVDEVELRRSSEASDVEAAILLESLDHSDDPAALLEAVVARLADGGLLFLTALVATGFDMVVLGLRNRYLCPPDRANCFSLSGLERLLERAGLSLLEVSTPGVLDLQIVQSHVMEDSTIPCGPFERQLLAADDSAYVAFQAFLQEHHLSSFARIVGRKDA